MTEFQLKTRPQGETLEQYQNDWGRVSMIMGPLGSGKTVQSCIKLFTAMLRQEPNRDGIRPSRFVAIRNTYSDLETTTIKDWIELFGELGAFTKSYPPVHQLDFELEDGTIVNSEVIFLALDRPDAVKKLRGMQTTGFWLNEAKELSKPVVDMADLRHGRYPSMAAGGVNCTWHGMMGDYNAPDDDHWLYRLAEEEFPEGWAFYRQPGGLLRKGDTFHENPNAENLHNLPSGYYTRGQAGKAQDWIKVNLCNEYGFVQEGKPVHPEYNDSVHCKEVEPNVAYPVVLGADFGRTPAIAFLQYIPGMGRWLMFDELLCEDMSAATFAPQVKQYIDQNYSRFKFKRGWGDPSGGNGTQATEDTAFSIFRANSVNLGPTDTNDPLTRRSALTGSLTRLCMDGKPAFIIHPRCKTARKGLGGGFCYKRVQVAGDERYKDEPDKNKYSHVCEALEYGLQGEGEGRKAMIGKARATRPVVANSNFSVF